MLTSFIGIDLAWAVDRNHTGIVVLEGDERGARISGVADEVTSLDEIVRFVREHSAGSTVAAVDAPLVVSNQTGSRGCELDVNREFGRYDASCHSSNLARTPSPAGVRLVKALAPLGFSHDFQLETAARRDGRWLFEVYPHPAMVVLFELTRIVKYKKGTVAQKRRGLRELQQQLQQLASPSCGLIGNPALEALLGSDVGEFKGRALKRYEDKLDALFCAYLAWYCWRWGAERNRMIGTLADGYIVVPRWGGR